MKVTLFNEQDKKKSYDAFVLFLHKDVDEGQLGSYPQVVKKVLKESFFKGEKNEVLFLPYHPVHHGRHLVIATLGSKKDFKSHDLLQSAAFIQKWARQKGIKSMAVDLSLARASTTGEAVKQVTMGLLLAHYKFNDHIQKKSKKTNGLREVFIIPSKKAINKSSSAKKILSQNLLEAEILSEATNFTRWLADTPGNLMTPSILAEQVRKKVAGTGLKVSIWNKEKIKKENMGGLLGVSLGSQQEPRFIIVEYKGARASQPPVCFVGKGLTFDSGGISIKPSARMDEMKYDMCGGACVIGAMLAISKLKLKINALGLIPSSENMPGPAANKPGDILKARNGKTMEVLNTDAEGRLILADALSYASEKKPLVIFDAATLTGAMVVALGNSHTGFYTRNKKLKERIEKASLQSGEKVWAMPLTDDHVSDIRSENADVANIATFPHGAGSATAAAFLEHFVDPSIPWAHFDIAGTAWGVSKRLQYCNKGASGVMVRTFVELAKSYI